MKTTYRTILSLIGFLSISSVGFGQLNQFSTIMNPFLSEPHENGFMNFQQPNSIVAGSCFQTYKTTTSDNNNDMILIESHIDTETSYTHFKYKQTYKGVDVEFGGCIEHFDSIGNLVLLNSMHVVDLRDDPDPIIKDFEALDYLIPQLSAGSDFAWLDATLEADYQLDEGNPNATRLPIPELLFAIDTCKNTGFNIDGNRYRLAYKMKVTTNNPFTTTIYYMDANSGGIFRKELPVDDNGPANVVGYGSQTIDTQWFGGFTQAHVLYANDATRKIHTKYKDGDGYIGAWWSVQNITDGDDIWGSDHLTEQTAHYFAMQSWDFYRQRFNRLGMNGANGEVRVRTGWTDLGAEFDPSGSQPLIRFGLSLTDDKMAHDPGIVGHEYFHGINNFTAGLGNSNEQGALNEGFADIFGIVSQTVMLDGGTTDWIIGNSITGAQPRVLSDPNLSIPHQPDTYAGNYWAVGAADNGGIHTNSSVVAHWFYILTEGKNGTNDNGDWYNVSGIGMLKSSWVAYYALTNIMQSGSEYVDARLATIQAAKILYGACSLEYQRTIDAWAAVGLGGQHNCSYTLDVSDQDIIESDVFIYPNPASTSITIEVPHAFEKEINLMDASGKIVKTLKNGTLLTQIDISRFANGIYTVLINIEGNVLVKKIIIE